ncbi:MAG: malonic semialdehyde reductase [Alphaproteobacteria bacterium]
MNDTATDQALDLLFSSARTPSTWTDRPIAPGLLEKIYDLAKMGPTSGNCSPLRLIFCCSGEARQKLADCAASGNKERILAAPATAIFADDLEFYENLPELFPHTDARSWFAGKQQHIETTAFRNAALQAAYYILAARACGLDAGPMSGFDEAKVQSQFLAGTPYRVNFLCSFGHADNTATRDHNPRLPFERACRVI